MSKSRLILVRHAEAEGNLNRRFHGWTNSSITEKGHIQASRVAERFKEIPVDIIYSSSLKRTLQTAEYIAAVKQLPIIRTDKLKEINGGDWEDRLFEELPVLWPEQNETWENKPHIHRMPNGETMVEFQERIIAEIRYILEHNPGKNICVVTHGTAIKTLMCYFGGCPLEELPNIPWYDNTAVSMIDYENDRFTIVMAGDASHLDIETSTFESQPWWQEYKMKFSKENQELTGE